MLESSLAVATGIVSVLTQHWGTFGTVLGVILIWGIPAISLLIEIAEFIVSRTPSDSDDKVVGKMKAHWQKILPWLEILPHANIPLSQGAIKAIALIKKLTAWLKSKKET